MGSIQLKYCFFTARLGFKLDICMILLAAKMCCTESSGAAAQINILAPCSCLWGAGEHLTFNDWATVCFLFWEISFFNHLDSTTQSVTVANMCTQASYVWMQLFTRHSVSFTWCLQKSSVFVFQHSHSKSSRSCWTLLKKKDDAW